MKAAIFFVVLYVDKVFVSGLIESGFGDFDQVETYTRILLHTKNGSILGGPRADSGPLIIDYPFPIHHSPMDYHLYQSSPEFTRPAANLQQPQYPHISSQYSPEPETHEKLTSFYHHLGSGLGHHTYLHPHKKKKKFYKKSGKYLVPLIVTLIAKIAHLLPTLKLILLTLFSLLLFAKKAFLVSTGALIIVLYEHFTNNKNSNTGGINLWKDRDQVQTHHEVHPGYGGLVSGEHKSGSEWWALEGANGTKITPRQGEKWRRWWAPQVKSHHPQPPPPQLEEAASLRERIRNNIKRFFGSSNADEFGGNTDKNHPL